MNIQFNGTWTEEQFKRFHQLSMPPSYRWMLKWFPWCWLGLFAFTILLNFAYKIDFKLVVNLLLLLVFWFSFSKLMEYNIKQAWQSNKLIKGEISGVIDQTEIIWKNAYGETRYPWEILLNYRETTDIVLLYIAINQAIMVPRNFFQSEEDWQQFRQLIVEKLPKKVA
jgi:hypothetical protein